MIIRPHILLFLTALLFTAAPFGVHAEIIRSMDVAVDVSQSGELTVRETIAYDFENEQRHGIFREIPMRFRSADGRRMRADISFVSVTDERGERYEYDLEGGTTLTVKIGDADAYVTGLKTYVLTYTVAHAVTAYADFDELYWNATGNEWDVAIASSSVAFTVPTAAQLRLACYIGITGSTDTCFISQEVTGDTSVVRAITRPLSPSEGVTVAIGFPKGAVVPAESPELLYDGRHLPFVALAALLLAVLGIRIAIRRERAQGRGTIIPEYEPPKNSEPAEADVIVHGKISSRAWPATIIHLAVRGYVTIEEVPYGPMRKMFGMGASDYIVTRTGASDEALEPYEKSLIDALFVDGVFSTKALKEDTARGTAVFMKMQAIQKDLYREAASDTGAYSLDPITANRRLGIGIVLLIAGIIGVPFTLALLSGAYIETFLYDYAYFIISIPLFVVAAFLYAYPRYMRPTLNATGAIEREKWLGFKLYLEKAERYRMQNLTPEMFEKFLPYAMVFGIEKKWARAFSSMNVPSPGWYHGAPGSPSFSPAVFAGAFSSNFHSSFASSAASGASGGGGSSGGGGGGGSGGSW